MRRFSASKVYSQPVPLPSLVMFPAASYAYVESVLMWLLASTVTLSVPLLHCVLVIVFRLAMVSGLKPWPQQSAPDVPLLAAEEMRFNESYAAFMVRLESTLFVTPVTLPLLFVAEVEQPLVK